MTVMTGGCLCGAVRYSCDAEPVMTGVCHCRDCQRQSGSAYSIFIGVPASRLRFESGTLSCYETRGASGQEVQRSFCGRCGSPIKSDVRSMPDLAFIKAGTLDDVSALQPQMHLWCGSAQTWVSFDDTVPQFPGNPPLG